MEKYDRSTKMEELGWVWERSRWGRKRWWWENGGGKGKRDKTK